MLDALARRGRSLAVAESYTGGLVHDALTRVPGASRVLRGGVVVYADDAKRRLLNVPLSTIRVHGAVSDPTALAMAHGARRALEADYAVATTGIAGPTGATPAKPLGTAYCAAAGPRDAVVRRHVDAGDRQRVREAGVMHAIAALAELLEGDGIL